MQKPKAHYVNNEVFLVLLKDYIAKRNSCIANNMTLPVIPNELGHIFIDIATRLSTRFNFVNYTYRDEMVSDGILNAVEAVHKFNPEFSSNPFGYFTKIIYWAFVRRIEKEKRDHKMRDDIMFDMTNNFYDTQDGESFDVNKDDTYLWYNN